MKQVIGMMVIVTLVCCLAFCEEPSVSPYNQKYERKAAVVEKVVPKETPKKKSDNPVSMF